MRILIVEDDPAVVSLVSRWFGPQGYVVEASSDGVDGLDRALHGNYDAAVIDLLLPGISGFEVILRMRQEGNHTPVLVLSGLTDLDNIVRALDVGADDYLAKPCRMEEFTARLRAIQRRGVSRPPDQVDVGPLRYDRPKRQVTISGLLLELTGKEFEILEQLVLASGRIVRRGDLFAALWEGDTAGGSNVLDVHVGHVRRKIARMTDLVRVDTIRGVGFRLHVLDGEEGKITEGPSPDPLVEPVYLRDR